MQGRRVHPNEHGALFLAPGDYGQDNDGDWYARPPNGHLGSLASHEVTEHEDGTITVAPSILVRWDGQRDGVDVVEEWHGYLERGLWRSC